MNKISINLMLISRSISALEPHYSTITFHISDEIDTHAPAIPTYL